MSAIKRGYSHRCLVHNWQVRITFVQPRLLSLLLRQKRNKVFQSTATSVIPQMLCITIFQKVLWSRAGPESESIPTPLSDVVASHCVSVPDGCRRQSPASGRRWDGSGRSSRPPRLRRLIASMANHINRLITRGGDKRHIGFSRAGVERIYVSKMSAAYQQHVN